MVNRIKKKAKRYAPRRQPAIKDKKARHKVAKGMKAQAEDRRRNGGQPSTYDSDFARQATELCERGATDADLADFFGVTTVTIWNWGTRHQEFFKAMHGGKDAFDERIVRSLAARAIGYSFSSEKVAINPSGKITRAPITEHVPPDPKAAEFWLTNRRSNEWKTGQQTHGFDPDRPMKIVVEGGLPKA